MIAECLSKFQYSIQAHELDPIIGTIITHQSIPAVPIPPPPWASAGHLLTLSVPGVGHSQFYRSLGAGH